MDWAAEAGFTWWQILPLNPTGYGNSPYQPLSSFACNPLLISPGELHIKGLLTRDELADARRPAGSRVVWETLLPQRHGLVLRAASRALALNPPGFGEFFDRNEDWLKPWARYAALKDLNGGESWTKWSDRAEDPDLEGAHMMTQFLFRNLWNRCRERCEQNGIRLLGDLPIYTALDSADVWSNPRLFRLDRSGAPLVVAGVPPDYFSPTGQLWGNPLYDWEAHRAEGYRWWSLRLGMALELCHTVRIDHFRAFCDYWEVPAGAATAREGRWREGPGKAFFDRVAENLGVRLPIVAEDLGMITPDVRKLREELGFPGMLVLQFALEDPCFNPSKVPRDTVLYTGTHDNDTTAGWVRSGRSGYDLDGVVNIALASPADLCVFPVQDVLGLGSEDRMNTPGTDRGNWSFRLVSGALSLKEAARWKRNISIAGRA
ncbi:MAG: 4-alpha-glucanotransferase [Candidatus Fermentibacteraceae bacterium]